MGIRRRFTSEYRRDVATLVSDMELVDGDGAFVCVAADEPVGVFIGSSLLGAVEVIEKPVHVRVEGQALMAGHFSALVPGQYAHRSTGKALDVAGECIADLVGLPAQGRAA